MQVYKSFPYHPSNGTFDTELSFNQQDVDFLVENGFNVVRLYVSWQGVEPTKGQYNQTYLNVRWTTAIILFCSYIVTMFQVLSDIVDMLGSAGIYTILDCHQDVWSPKFCGESTVY